MSALARLLEQATPGPWVPIYDEDDEERAWVLGVPENSRTYVTPAPSRNEFGLLDADARLIALAPDMARLLIDMADALAYVSDDWRDRVGIEHPAVLLTRFAELEQRAAQ